MMEQKYEYAMNQAESRHQLFEERNNGIMKNQRVSEYLIDNYVAVRILENRKQELIEQRQNSMKELENRITSNNMNIPESRQDSECQRLAKEIERIEQKISNCDYRVAKLQTDNQIVSQETGIVIEEKQKNSIAFIKRK